MEADKNQAKRPNIKELLDNFAGYSTLHGLHFIVDASSYIRKLIWFFLLIGSTSFFAYMAHQGWGKWRKYDVLITTEIKKNEVGSVSFPSVTICNRNMMKKSKILGTDSQRYLDALDLTLRYKWSAIYNQMNQSFNIEQAVFENGHHLKDMVKRCYANGLPCTFSRSLDFSSGLCHTFNSNGTIKLFKKGSSHGISLLLDAEPEEYYGVFSRSGVGFSIMVHEKDDQPTPELDGWDVPTGFATNFILRRKEIIRQPAPYPSKCGEIQLQSSKVYSDGACIFETYTKKVVDKCHCRICGMPVIEIEKFCLPKQIMDCAFPILISQNHDPKECSPPCNKVEYDIKTSSLLYPSGDVLEKTSEDIKKMYESSNAANRSFYDWYRSRFAFVKVFFHTTDTEVMREIPAYEFVDFLAGFGGNMGLLLGCSVLTVVEFIDVFVLVIIEWYRKKKSKIRTVSASGEEEYNNNLPNEKRI